MKIPNTSNWVPKGNKKMRKKVYLKDNENFPDSSKNTNLEPGSLTYPKRNKQRLLRQPESKDRSLRPRTAIRWTADSSAATTAVRR